MTLSRRTLFTGSAGALFIGTSAGLVWAARKSDSSPLAVGDSVPPLQVTDATGKAWNISQYKGTIVVLEWTSPSCPFVRAHYDSGNMQRLQRWAKEQDVVWLSVLSTGPTRGDYLIPRDAQTFNTRRQAAPAALLMDDSGDLGRRFNARTTPHMFVIDKSGKLAYAGAIDDKPMFSFSKTGGEKATNYVKAGVEELLAGKPITTPQTRPYGCGIGYAS